MVRKPVEQRGRHLGITEHTGPFSEAQVGGDDDAGSFVELAEQVEQHGTAGLAERQIAELVENHKIGIHESRGDGVARIIDMTDGLGADSVLECVGTKESMMQAIHCARQGGHVGYVGVPHGVELNVEELFFEHVHLHGGPAPVRQFLPELIDLVWTGKINPGRVFDLKLPFDQVAEGYKAMDERRAIKALLMP